MSHVVNMYLFLDVFLYKFRVWTEKYIALDSETEIEFRIRN